MRNSESIHTFVVLAYKESKFLENCIQSVLNQTYKSKVVIATSTPNKYIETLAEKYSLKIYVNPDSGKGIGADFDFAVSCGETDLVTVAHQDDIYDKDYSKLISDYYTKYRDAIILFSDYYEIKNMQEERTNLNLKIKRLLLLPLTFKTLCSSKLIKRSCLCLGNAICCPAVTFVKTNITLKNIFQCHYKCNIDWYAWERLTKEKGKFIFVKKKLMGHRVHEESTTTEIIGENLRTKEDYDMFLKFWPKPIANIINSFYKYAEKGNKV